MKTIDMNDFMLIRFCTAIRRRRKYPMKWQKRYGSLCVTSKLPTVVCAVPRRITR